VAVVRLLLVVLVATALVAIALPPIEAARTDAATTAARDQLTSLQTAVRRLATTNDPVPGALPAARRHLTLTVPQPGPGSTGVSYLAIGAVPNTTTPDGPAGDVLAYRLPGGPTRVIRTSVDLRVVVDGHRRDDDTPLILRDRTRLTIAYVIVDGTPIVRVTPVRL